MIGNVTLALAAAAAGLGLLYGAWQRRVPRRWRPVPVGWALLLVSAWFWVNGTGAEFGVSLLLLATSVVAWGFVIANRQYRERRPRADSTAPKAPADARSLAAHVLLFLLTVPLAAVTATLVAVALSLALPWSRVDAMVTVLVLIPILWGCAAYWVVADSRPLRPAAAMLLGAALSTAVIYA